MEDLDSIIYEGRSLGEILAAVAVPGLKEGALVRCKGFNMALAVVVSESNFGGPTVEILEGRRQGDSIMILEKNLMILREER